jgi:hypothetical protein
LPFAARESPPSVKRPLKQKHTTREARQTRSPVNLSLARPVEIQGSETQTMQRAMSTFMLVFMASEILMPACLTGIIQWQRSLFVPYTNFNVNHGASGGEPPWLSYSFLKEKGELHLLFFDFNSSTFMVSCSTDGEPYLCPIHSRICPAD